MAPAHSPDLGRFAEPAMLVLVSLTDGPRHGYAITSDVETFSEMERFVRTGRLRAAEGPSE